MHCFLDTNVLIGNVFSIDPLHEYSINVWIDNAKFYYSEHVKKEFEYKYSEKIRLYNAFFDEFSYYVESLNFDESLNPDFVNISKLYKFIYDFKKYTKFSIDDMRKTIDTFLYDCNLSDNPRLLDISSSLSEFIQEFNSKIILTKIEICDFLIEVPNFKKNYFQIKQMIKNENLPTHKEDIDILLDAHEFAYNNKNLILYFITGDKGLFETINKLLDVLCIEKCCQLKDF